MATWIRRIVSGQKKRFQNEGFDLDLAYISPRVIAMGLPAQGKDVLYRNPLPEIARFLQTYHKGRAKVYNLCSEYKYSAEKLSVALQHYPFDDHQTPALLVVQQFCADAAEWLAQHPHNVVVVHCKAGKGRTGLMICSLLMYLHKNAPDLANLPAKAAQAPSDAVGSDAAVGIVDCGNCPTPACQVTRQVTTTAVTSPFTNRSLERSSSDFNSSRVHPAGSRPLARSSKSSSTSSDSKQSVEAGSLFRSRSLPSGRSSNGWHPWQHVAPVQLQRLTQPVHDILALYAERRTHDGNGVTIASQRRYVGYFWHVLSAGPQPCGILPPPRTLQLRELVITGLPPGTADGCSVLVEARASGSDAASASRVWLSPARRTSVGSMPGLQLCMGPCTLPPQVQDDSCYVAVSPGGDSMTIKLPAASLGLSLFSRTTAFSVPACSVAAAAACTQVNNFVQPVQTSARGRASVDELQSPFAAVAAAAIGPVGTNVSSAELAKKTVARDSCSISEPGDPRDCCVVEGDVRVSVIKGGTKLFFAWFNTAFMPAGGSLTLSRAYLDKVPRNLPQDLTMTVKYVDMQPQAGAEHGTAAAIDTDERKEDLQGAVGYGSPRTTPDGAPTASRSGSYKATALAPLTLPNSSSSGNLAVTDLAVSSNLRQLGSSLSAPASPQASRIARAASWLQFPTLSSLGSLPAPLQWPSGGLSSSRDPKQHQVHNGAIEDVGFSSVPADGVRTSRRDRRVAGKGRHRAGRGGRRLDCDSSGSHFWDWSWACLAEAAAGTETESATAAGDIGSQGGMLNAVNQQGQEVKYTAAMATGSGGLQLQRDPASGRAAGVGIELHAFGRASCPVLTTSAQPAAAPVALSAVKAPAAKPRWLDHHQQQLQQRQQPVVADLADDETDGGDTFATDIYGLPDSCDPLLQASAPSAAPGVVLGAHDPLQGLLEAWHWSLDTRSSRRQQQRRHTYCSSSASSSRASSPGPAGNRLEGGGLVKMLSFPSAPTTPGRSSSSMSRPSWIHGSKDGTDSSTTAPRSYAVVASAAAGVKGTEQVFAAQAATAADVAIAPVTPQPATPALTASSRADQVNPGTLRTAAADKPAGAASASCCLDCLFDMHIGPCPLSQVARSGGLASVSAGTAASEPLPQPAFLSRSASSRLDAAAPAPAPATTPASKGTIMRSASTPDSRTAAATAAVASCTVTVATSAAADAVAAAGADAMSKAVVSPAQTAGTVSSAGRASAASHRMASASARAWWRGKSANRHSIDVTARSSTSTGANIGSNSYSTVPWRSTTGDLVSCSAGSCSSMGDDQMQGLLQSGQQSSTGPSTDAESEGRKSVAALVQQWQQLERAWERNWL